MRSLANELEDAEDGEVTARPQIHVNGGTVLVSDTGKFPAVDPKALAAREPVSETPTKVKAARSFFEIFPPGLGRVVVAVAILIVVGLAIWKGVSLPGLP